jgi:FeS assembly SUF system protein
MNDREPAEAGTPKTGGAADGGGPSTGNPEAIKQRVIDMLHTVYDPEIPVDIYELGLIYDVDVNRAGEVHVEMTLTSPACPVAGSLPPEVEQKVASVDGVTGARVDVVWDPPWTPDLMSEAAKLELGLG